MYRAMQLLYFKSYGYGLLNSYSRNCFLHILQITMKIKEEIKEFKYKRVNLILKVLKRNKNTRNACKLNDTRQCDNDSTTQRCLQKEAKSR